MTFCRGRDRAGLRLNGESTSGPGKRRNPPVRSLNALMEATRKARTVRSVGCRNTSVTRSSLVKLSLKRSKPNRYQLIIYEPVYSTVISGLRHLRRT
ncbi:hypothetical protein PoB_005764200 [Plakobranchus ocellatus]|uniref:Uncharacterized protein n=1 Tax=Plakobranchus ocellatus TaxID=259542 RepID=A0AAV4CHQ0_9GAST|nr:hypothetical protein PoB_005764200 [Plakobranchus ocellatus]